jgi:Flp pilus assembly protein TadD
MNGKYDGAIADARNALALDPSDDIAQMALALAYLRTGKFAEAEKQATKALTGGRNAYHLYARAIARAQLGNANGAREDLKAAQQMQFDIMLEPAFFGLKAI